MGVRDESNLLFYQVLKDHGVPAEIHIYPYGGHSFGLAIGSDFLETWTEHCVDWLRSLQKAYKK